MDVFVGYVMPLGFSSPFPLCMGLCILFLREFYESYFSVGLAVKRTGTSAME